MTEEELDKLQEEVIIDTVKFVEHACQKRLKSLMSIDEEEA